MKTAAEILTDILGDDIADRINPDAMLVDDLGFDSLDFIELQINLQDLGAAAPDDAFPSHMKVSDVEALLATVPA